MGVGYKEMGGMRGKTHVFAVERGERSKDGTQDTSTEEVGSVSGKKKWEGVVRKTGRKSEKAVTKAKGYMLKSQVSNTERSSMKRNVGLAMM